MDAMTYGDLAEGERLVLVLTGAPFDGRDERLPDALDELAVGQRLLGLLGLDVGDDLCEHVDQFSDT